jgi:hypothetical protein
VGGEFIGSPGINSLQSKKKRMGIGDFANFNKAFVAEQYLENSAVPNAFGIPKVCTEIDCKQVFLNRIHNKVRILGSGHMYKTGEMKLAGITLNEVEIICSNPPPPLVWTSKKKRKEMK